MLSLQSSATKRSGGIARNVLMGICISGRQPSTTEAKDQDARNALATNFASTIALPPRLRVLQLTGILPRTVALQLKCLLTERSQLIGIVPLANMHGLQLQTVESGSGLDVQNAARRLSGTNRKRGIQPLPSASMLFWQNEIMNATLLSLFPDNGLRVAQSKYIGVATNALRGSNICIQLCLIIEPRNFRMDAHSVLGRLFASATA